MSILEQLQGRLVVSCQPVDGGPMDRPDIVAAMACAVVAGGAAGVRIEGIENLQAVRSLLAVPIIGITKRDLVDTPVRITPSLDDVRALIEAGADIIAYDATGRLHTDPPEALVSEIRNHGRIAMADCSDLADGKRAIKHGATILGTTLSGYTSATAGAGEGPDLDLVGAFRDLGAFVMAEGRFNTPASAAAAIGAGADCVTVGTALTRLEHVTGWFAEAIAEAGQ